MRCGVGWVEVHTVDLEKGMGMPCVQPTKVVDDLARLEAEHAIAEVDGRLDGFGLLAEDLDIESVALCIFVPRVGGDVVWAATELEGCGFGEAANTDIPIVVG